jgi:hypothetical protein
MAVDDPLDWFLATEDAAFQFSWPDSGAEAGVVPTPATTAAPAESQNPALQTDPVLLSALSASTLDTPNVADPPNQDAFANLVHKYQAFLADLFPGADNARLDWVIQFYQDQVASGAPTPILNQLFDLFNGFVATLPDQPVPTPNPQPALPPQPESPLPVNRPDPLGEPTAHTADRAAPAATAVHTDLTEFTNLLHKFEMFLSDKFPDAAAPNFDWVTQLYQEQLDTGFPAPIVDQILLRVSLNGMRSTQSTASTRGSRGSPYCSIQPFTRERPAL